MNSAALQEQGYMKPEQKDMTNDYMKDAEACCQNPESVLARTLCLMSLNERNQSPVLTRHIVQNLAVLSHHPAFSRSFREICESLHDEWCRHSTYFQPDGEQRACSPFYIHPEDNKVH